MLTLDQLNTLPPKTIFAQGETPNSPEGVYMTDINIGRMMIWAAKTGGNKDWCIYIHWADNGLDFALQQGDKVTGTNNIKKLVPCTPEALSRYRY